MKIGDVIVLDDQSATITSFFTNKYGVEYLIARWHEEQNDGCQVTAIQLDAFNVEQVMPS